MRINGHLSDVDALLALERVGETTLRGRAIDPGWGQLYGGHVFAQSLAAARATVPPDRAIHMHRGDFLLPGDVTTPIDYAVETSRDGRSFSARRVAAYQGGRLIFTASTSFHVPEDGFAHQDPMPAVLGPEGVLNEAELLDRFADRLPPAVRAAIVPSHGFELRPLPVPDDPVAPSPAPPRRDVWLRGNGPGPEDVGRHALLLAYASDYLFVPTALMPHGVSWFSPWLHLATLSHTVWFHAPARVDEWVLHTMRSPWAGQGRGLAQGAFYDRAGRLVATTAQEGLMRKSPRR